MTIYWWDTDKLVERLGAGRLSESESLPYGMVTAVLYTVAVYLAMWFGGSRGWLLLGEFVAVTAVALMGVSACFKANEGSLGDEFLKRLTVLGVPVGIKVMLAGVALGQVVYLGFPYVATPISLGNPAFVYALVVVVLNISCMAFYYWRIAFHLRRVVQASRSGR